MAFSVPLDDARRAFTESVEAFVGVVERTDELALLEGSRCRGWSRLDVVVHVLTGWQDVLSGLVSAVEDPPTVDAASFWRVFAEGADDDPVAVLMAQRRRTAAYARPSSAIAHLRDVAAAVQRGAAALPDGSRLWLGEVFTLGDFLATWAVEHAVHHLDLHVDEPPPASALALARTTVEALLGEELPVADDARAVLVGTGRLPVPADLAHLADRLPAFG